MLRGNAATRDAVPGENHLHSKRCVRFRTEQRRRETDCGWGQSYRIRDVSVRAEIVRVVESSEGWLDEVHGKSCGVRNEATIVTTARKGDMGGCDSMCYALVYRHPGPGRRLASIGHLQCIHCHLHVASHQGAWDYFRQYTSRLSSPQGALSQSVGASARKTYPIACALLQLACRRITTATNPNKRQ